MRNYLEKNSMLAVFDNDFAPVLHTNCRTNPPCYKLDSHSHEFYQLIYVTDGVLTVTADQNYECRTGDVIIIPPDIPHLLKSDEGYRQLGIDFLKCDDETNPLYPFLMAVQSIFHSRISSLIPISKEIGNRLRDYSLISDQIMMSYVKIFTLTVWENMSSLKTDYFGTRLSDYLEKNLDKDLSIKEIAADLSVSRSHLQRLCNQCYGIGVRSLFNRKRYSRSCSLLANTEKTIAKIAEEIGFSTPANFSSFFKKYSGMSPAVYRKNNIM